MAEYGIVIVNDKVKGNCVLKGFENAILAHTVNMNSQCNMTNLKAPIPHVAVTQGAISVTIVAGKWLAEIMNHCYNCTPLGDVTISQLGQSVDSKTLAAPTIVQEIKLKDVKIGHVGQDWSAQGDARTAVVSLVFSHIDIKIGDKLADFTLKNVTSGAV